MYKFLLTRRQIIVSAKGSATERMEKNFDCLSGCIGHSFPIPRTIVGVVAFFKLAVGWYTARNAPIDVSGIVFTFKSCLVLCGVLLAHA